MVGRASGFSFPFGDLQLRVAAIANAQSAMDAARTGTPPRARATRHRRKITNALWCACHGGQRETAEYLLDQGADINWIGHDALTPIDAAARSDARQLVEWLRALVAEPAAERRTVS